MRSLAPCVCLVRSLSADGGERVERTRARGDVVTVRCGRGAGERLVELEPAA